MVGRAVRFNRSEGSFRNQPFIFMVEKSGDRNEKTLGKKVNFSRTPCLNNSLQLDPFVVFMTL